MNAYRCSESEILAAMEQYGGGFVSQLAHLYRLGDPSNQRILAQAFSHYFAQYDELALIHKQREVENQGLKHLRIL